MKKTSDLAWGWGKSLSPRGVRLSFSCSGRRRTTSIASVLSINREIWRNDARAVPCRPRNCALQFLCDAYKSSFPCLHNDGNLLLPCIPAIYAVSRLSCRMRCLCIGQGEGRRSRWPGWKHTRANLHVWSFDIAESGFSDRDSSLIFHRRHSRFCAGTPHDVWDGNNR